MEDVRRGVALAALAVACVLGGPTPEVAAAAERLVAVRVVDAPTRRRVRRSDRVPPARRGPTGPQRDRASGPAPRRPS